MKLIERLALFIENKGISYNAFDRLINASNGYIGKQIKNKASVGSDVIQKIANIYPELNLNWLITGEGNMITITNNSENNRNTIIIGNKNKADKKKIITIEKQEEDHQDSNNQLLFNIQQQLKELKLENESLKREIIHLNKIISLLEQQRPSGTP